MMHKGDTSKRDRIRQLLDELNEWEQKYGTHHTADPLLKDTGESNARIAELKAELAELGAQVHWNGQEYVLSAPADPDSTPTHHHDGESGSASGAGSAED